MASDTMFDIPLRPGAQGVMQAAVEVWARDMAAAVLVLGEHPKIEMDTTVVIDGRERDVRLTFEMFPADRPVTDPTEGG